jgi:putative nucleotidyltransferase with HDIG domain
MILEEGMASAEKAHRILQAGSLLRSSGLVDAGRTIGLVDVERVTAFLLKAAPHTAENYRLHVHLLLTAKLARRIAEKVGLDPLCCQVAGLLHDLGRFVTHRYYRTELLGIRLLENLGIRTDIRACLLPLGAYIKREDDQTLADLSPEQRVVAIADVCGKRRDDATICSFEEVLRKHLETRGSQRSYLTYSGMTTLWPSEQQGLRSLGPTFAGHWATIYLGIRDWLGREHGVDLELLREELSAEERTQPLDTVIFDVGGVLIDNPDPLLHEELQRCCENDPQRIEAVRRELPALQTGQLSEETFWERVAPRLQIPLLRDRQRFWACQLKPEVRVAVRRLVERLIGRGFRVIVLSDTIPPHARLLQAAGVYDGFHDIVLSTQIGCTKGQGTVAPFWIAALRQGRLPQECLMIDDNPTYLEQARTLGMRTVPFRSHEQLARDLARLGLLESDLR